MRAVANGSAKELLTVAGKPLIEHALADLESAGVTDAWIVTSPAKPELAARLGERRRAIRLHYLEQCEPRGLADAIALAEPFLAGEPFLVWLPDNLWRSDVDAAASAQLVAALHRAPGSHLVALLELPSSRLASHGAAGFVATTPLAGTRDVVRIERVFDKGTRPDLAGAATVLKGFPLDLYKPDLFDRIRARRERHASGELDDTPLLQELAREGRLLGVVLRGGTLFDCGMPDGLAAARARLGE